jgi:hypothetical protein
MMVLTRKNNLVPENISVSSLKKNMREEYIHYCHKESWDHSKEQMVSE